MAKKKAATETAEPKEATSRARKPATAAAMEYAREQAKVEALEQRIDRLKKSLAELQDDHGKAEQLRDAALATLTKAPAKAEA